MEFNNLIMLMQTMSESALTEFQYEENGVRIYLSKFRRPEMHPGDKVPIHPGSGVPIYPGCTFGAAAPGQFAGWEPNGFGDVMQQRVYAEGMPAGAYVGGTTAEAVTGVYAERLAMGAPAGMTNGGTTAGAQAGNIVTSPLVGVFYAAPSEDAAPFVSVGDTVKKGQQLAIVEAMKLMNEIECEFDGTIAEVLVENGQAVEYGQPLFRIV